ncbi:hypothetical protein LTR97_008021 [Elasticomyces elasticus]|uniref:Spherulin-4 n=1 Tax=Elasticomyces elasticus TaxID=574655 RepID=A0AAN7W4F3_9PEZI|nr:hypothetical protein LTR97_008021 [Elasticomyces elasticus]
MVNYGFILVPLYIYPLPGAWDGLFKVAKTYPSVTFQAVINPDTGPGDSACPNSDFITSMAELNSIPNIQTLAYVHTAANFDCGPGTWICPATQPQSALENNITKYQNWNIPGKCTDADVHIDGIFFDEAPSDANATTYMSDITSFAKSTLTRGSTVLFNAGQAVDPAYWSIADYINVLEDTEVAYDSADIGALNGEGKYHAQTTIILHDYASGPAILERDVSTILSTGRDAMAGLYITDLDVYNKLPTNFTGFAEEVAKVVAANAAAVGINS